MSDCRQRNANGRTPLLRRCKALATIGAVIFVIPSLSRAEPACLPKQLFEDDQAYAVQKFDLGLVAGTPTLCAPHVEMSADNPVQPAKAGYVACYTVDAVTGALSPSSATYLPGHSQLGLVDAQGCLDGYCPEPKAQPDAMVLWVESTDGAHRAIRNDATLNIFDTTSKKQTKAIPLYGDGLPDNTVVSNEPIKLLYTGNAIYVVGTDAGPYLAVWAFKDDGERKGVVRSSKMTEEQLGGYSVYNGAANLIDDRHMAVANFGFQSMIVIDTATGTQQEIARNVDLSACTATEMENVNVGTYEFREGEEYSDVSKACNAAVVKNLESYFDLDPVRLANGDLLATQAEKNRGAIVVLDGATLAEKSRHILARCKD